MVNLEKIYKDYGLADIVDIFKWFIKALGKIVPLAFIFMAKDRKKIWKDTKRTFKL